MQQTLIIDLAQHLGEEITLKGWVRTIRHSGKLLFIVLRDGTGEVQCVAFQPDLGEAAFDTAKRLTMESSLIVTGTAKPHQKQTGQFEVAVKSIQPVQIAEEYPIGKKEHGPDFLLSNRHLWIRSSKQWASCASATPFTTRFATI